MHFSLHKLKEYITLTETDPQKISEIITEKSAEIEEITIEGEFLKNVVVGKIRKIFPHPEASKIQITETEIGGGEVLQIICGGSNISENMLVPVALPGAILPGNFAIKKGKIRGVESNGMLCGADEIGIDFSLEGKSKIWEQEKAILEILGEVELGTPIAEYLEKNDIIYEVENTSITNRADQFSHIGIAREFVACELGTWKTSDPFLEDIKIPKGIEKFPIEILFPEHQAEIIPKYLAITVDGVNGTTESFPAMKNFLTAIGLEPKNALVDISNVVMFETGSPVHIFDREKVGKKWEFFLSEGGETITTLDGDEKKLPQSAIVLKDESGEIFDLCGIQGGKNSGIWAETKNIVVHVPIYDAVKIRRTSLAVDHRTDASIIYEKSVPSKTADFGMARTLELLQEIFPESKISSELFSSVATDETEKNIFLSRSVVNRVMGIEIETAELEKIFSGLAFKFSVKDGGWDITVPFFRGDISIPEDIIEEIARMYGLNKIPALAPQIMIEKKSPLPSREVERKISQVFVKNGFYEILTLAFLGEKLLNRMGLKSNEETMCFVKNPLSADLDTMRASLSPRLFETAERNIRFQEKFRLFESGNVFRMEGDKKIEEYRITSLLVGDDFFTAKAIAEEIFETFGVEYRIQEKKYNLPFAHPSRGAEMVAGKDASVKLFQVHPKIAKEFSIPEHSSVVCITLKPFENLLLKTKKVSALPKFPGISYDVSVVCDEKLAVEMLVKNFSRVDELIVSAKVQSLWRGEGIEKGKKSVTLSFEFRAEDRTLTDTEAKELEKKLLAELEKRGGKFRF